MAKQQIQVDGLTESIKFLGKVDKELRKEAVNVLRKGALKIKGESQQRMAATPGVRRSSYPLFKSAIIHRASGKGASVGINRAASNGRNATIFAAEFGAGSQWIPYNRGAGKRGRFVPQNSMRRRTFPVYRGNQFKSRGKAGPGWIVQPTIRKWVPKIEDQLEADMEKVFNKAARRAGVPRGR